MSSQFNPEESIVALFSPHPAKPGRHRFVGTAFFVQPQTLVTADHVVEDARQLSMGVAAGPLPEVPLERSKMVLRSLDVVRRDPGRDIAILRCSDYSCRSPLALNTEPLLGIEQVYCYEYSRSAFGRSGDFFVEASTRVGNIVRYVDDLRDPPSFPTNCLELSFPAVSGASGAPVLSRRDGWAVVGVVVSNVSYELLPIQTIKVTDEIDGQPISEETKYYLPHGLAVNASHLEHVVNASRSQQAT